MNLKCFFIVLLFTVQSYGQEKQFIVFFDFNKDVPNETSQNKIDMWVLENKNIEIEKLIKVYKTRLVGFGELRTQIAVQVFPNPASNWVKIETAEPIQQLYLIDMMGKLVLAAQNVSEIDVSDYANGTYVLQVQTAKGLATKRIQVNH
jgi:hypothetical protein